MKNLTPLAAESGRRPSPSFRWTIKSKTDLVLGLGTTPLTALSSDNSLVKIRSGGRRRHSSAVLDSPLGRQRSIRRRLEPDLGPQSRGKPTLRVCAGKRPHFGGRDPERSLRSAQTFYHARSRKQTPLGHRDNAQALPTRALISARLRGRRAGICLLPLGTTAASFSASYEAKPILAGARD